TRGVLNYELFGGAQQLVYGPGSRHTIHDPGHLEIGVLHGRADEHCARRDACQDLGEVKWHLVGIIPVLRCDARHVATVTPSGEVAATVRKEGVETTTADDRFQTRIKGGRKKRV